MTLTYLVLILGVKAALFATFVGIGLLIPVGMARAVVMLVADILFVGSAASALSATFRSYRVALCGLFIVLFGLYAVLANGVVALSMFWLFVHLK